MIDLEKVIAALHCRAYDDDFPCWKCAYYKQDEKPVARCDYRGLMDDAISLLKEPEPVKPVKYNHNAMYLQCGNCGEWLLACEKFCSNCGRKVKRNDL